MSDDLARTTEAILATLPTPGGTAWTISRAFVLYRVVAVLALVIRLLVRLL